VLVEIGVLMTVTAVIVAIFYAFAGRTPEITDEDW
jgi:multicomponent Na+:H+ antiporter subunit B